MCPYETHKLAKTGGILFNHPPPPQDPGLMAMTAHRVWHYTLQYSRFVEKVLKDTGNIWYCFAHHSKMGGCANLSTHPSTLSTCSRGDVQISQGWSIRVRSLYGVGSGPVWGAIKSLHFRCSVMQSYANFEGDTWYCVPHPPKYWGGGDTCPPVPLPLIAHMHWLSVTLM